MVKYDPEISQIGAIMRLCNYAIMQLCNYAIMQLGNYAIIELCKYADYACIK